MKPARRYALLGLALAAAVLAFLWTRSLVGPRGGATPTTSYCYALRSAWACATTRTECEARLAREPLVDPSTRCQAHDDDVLTP
jgi:hypothetical protein